MKRLLFVVFSVVSLFSLVFGSAPVLAAPPQKIDVLIGFRQPPGQSERELVRGIGGDVKYIYRIISAIGASVPEAAIQGLLKNPRVITVEPDVTVRATDAELDTSWGVQRIGAGFVHPSNTGSDSTVAILDTGIDYRHPDLAGRYIGGYDFVNGDSDPMDDNGHGTHVAGIIAANDDGSGVVGVAPGAKIIALKVLDKNGSGSYLNIIAALDWICGEYGDTPKAQITNNSYGGTGYPGTMVQNAFDFSYALWGVLNVAAAGNSGNSGGTGDSVEYPGRFTSVIAVAATDSNDVRGYFSSTGTDVELAAPGLAITSTVPNNGYATWSGTSMASPHVAGTAALVKTAYPSWTNSQIRTRLQQTADDRGATGRDTLYGYGLVDADEAAGVPNNQPPTANAGGPYTGTEDIAVSFGGSKSSDPDGDSLTYSWTFGDGSIGTGVNPSHAYTAGGSYTVTLVVNDGKVNSGLATTTATITGVNDPPVANAGPDRNAVVGQQIAFDGSASSDADGSIISYNWAFGDGGSGSGVTASHSYVSPGMYSVVLTVTDNGGSTATDSAVVTVTAAPGNLIHVASIAMNIKKAGQNTGATATVTILDGNGLPVLGATVYGHWSEATRDQDYGLTDPAGRVTLQSDYVKKAVRGTRFTFTVDNVMLAGKTYSSAANAETSDSITTP